MYWKESNGSLIPPIILKFLHVYILSCPKLAPSDLQSFVDFSRNETGETHLVFSEAVISKFDIWSFASGKSQNISIIYFKSFDKFLRWQLSLIVINYEVSFKRYMNLSHYNKNIKPQNSSNLLWQYDCLLILIYVPKNR